MCIYKTPPGFKKVYPLFLLILLAFLIASGQMSAETNKDKAQAKAVFPDEYSELDDKPVENKTTDQLVLSTLESARQQYLLALKKIEKGDTLAAAKHFEKALKVLNTLVDYQGIEQNEEFTDLAQSIIDDYETFIANIENLDENTSLFIIRDKLFQEIENYTASVAPEIQNIPIPVDTMSKYSSLPPNFKFSIPLDDNEYVQKNITFLTTHKLGKKFIRESLNRRSRWFPLIFKIAKEEDVPPEIAFLSVIESGLDPNAVSKAKAVGLWQFIRSTGEDYGLNKNGSVWIDERRDPEKATRAAMRHVRDLYIELGDWYLVMAAYNCGIGCVRRTVQRVNVEKPTFWDLFPKLPKETRNYVPQYIAVVKVMMNPEAYGFDINDINQYPEYQYETVELKEPVNLTALAKCAGITEQELRYLNPELIKSISPADLDKYILKVPTGKTEHFKKNFALLTPEDKMPIVYHKIVKGETIGKIAEMYNVTAKEIASFNGIPSTKAKLKKGTSLMIPIDKDAVKPVLASGKQKQDEDEQADNEPVVVAKKNEKQTTDVAKNDNTKLITHKVQKGENLTQIAQKYGVRLSDLRNLNNISYDSDNIIVGTELIISSAKGPVEQYEPVITKIERKPKIVKHTVKKGETLAQIADEYEVSIQSILELNKIKKNKIMAGQSIKIETNSRKVADNTSDLDDSPQLKTHKVKKGENMSTIAAKYGISEDDIRKWNPQIVEGTKIYSGTRLKIYTNESAKGSSPAVSPKANKVPKYYTVRKGDNLSDISQKFGVTIASLRKYNKSIKGDILSVGQKIRLQ